MGEYDPITDLPFGYIRAINEYGNIYEGSFTSDFKINGFCVSFIGSSNEIWVGWYKNRVPHGNWMSLDGSNLSIINSGWYEKGCNVGPMRDDEKFKKFTIRDIFIDAEKFIQK